MVPHLPSTFMSTVIPVGRAPWRPSVSLSLWVGAVACGAPAAQGDNPAVTFRVVRSVCEDEPIACARAALEARASGLGLGRAATQAFRVVGARPVVAGGTRVSFRAEVDGLTVLGTEVEVLLGLHGETVAVTFGPAVADVTLRRAGRARIAADEAARRGYEALTGDPTGPAARAARPVWFVHDRQLVPAWEVEFVGPHPDLADRLVLDAESGAILAREPLVDDATYQTWADPTGDLRPREGPYIDVIPHPSGAPGGASLEVARPSPITVLGRNRFKDPWLPSGSETLHGNHATIYAERVAPDVYSAGDLKIVSSAVDEWTHTYDFDADARATDAQALASGTHAFYVVNWLADMYYDAGFDEVAHNAQRSNYGRGGVELDPLSVRVQSYRATNSAFASTPGDGISPQLSFGVWTPLGSVETDGGSRYVSGSALFGPTGLDVCCARDTGAPEGGKTPLPYPEAHRMGVTERFRSRRRPPPPTCATRKAWFLVRARSAMTGNGRLSGLRDLGARRVQQRKRTSRRARGSTRSSTPMTSTGASSIGARLDEPAGAAAAAGAAPGTASHVPREIVDGPVVPHAV